MLRSPTIIYRIFLIAIAVTLISTESSNAATAPARRVRRALQTAQQPTPQRQETAEERAQKAREEEARQKKVRENAWFSQMVTKWQPLADQAVIEALTAYPVSSPTTPPKERHYVEDQRLKYYNRNMQSRRNSEPGDLTTVTNYPQGKTPDEESIYKLSMVEASFQAAKANNAPALTNTFDRFMERSGEQLDKMAKAISNTDNDNKFYETVLTKIVERCNKNIATLGAPFAGTTTAATRTLHPLCGKYTADKTEKPTSWTDIMTVEPAWAYRRDASTTEPQFYTSTTVAYGTTTSTTTIIDQFTINNEAHRIGMLEQCKEARQLINAELVKKNLNPSEQTTLADVLKAQLTAREKAQAAVEAAAIKAQSEADQSGKNLEKILGFAENPKNWLLGVGAFGAGVGLYHLLPRLIAKKPQIVSEMSFLSPWERLMGKKLPPSAFEQIIFTKETGPQVMRAVAHIRRVVNSGGELMNLIFFGPPGTGKTMTAKAIARTVGADYMLINASAFEQLSPGEAVSELEATFRMARSNKKPVLVFFDEADAVMGRRGTGMETQTSRRVINTFLANVTDTHNRKIMFVLATNIPKTLDPAVLSRFPEAGWFYFGVPSPEERANILRMYLDQFFKEQNVTLSEEVKTNMRSYTDNLPNATGRNLRALARDIADRMVDESSKLLTDTLMRETLNDIEANRKNMEKYAY